MIKVMVNKCGKYGYLTEDDARQVILGFDKKSKKKCKAIYRCKECGMLHLTHHKPNGRTRFK